jgi:aminoglycoside 2'-N-acetyltransferase I
LRTAYVEAVATEPGLQGQGLASAIMRRLASCITDYDFAALSPAQPGLYRKVGWEFWRGPLFIRTADGLLPTPDESIMCLALPKTPPLDWTLPLSAEWREGEVW